MLFNSLCKLNEFNIYKMNSKKYNFNFPSTVLKEEDFSPIETFAFKDYYRISFIELVQKVIQIIYNITSY